MLYNNYLGLVITLLLVMTIPWLISIRTKNVSTVDSYWSLMILALTGGYAALLDDVGVRGWIIIGMVTFWAIRLSLHITVRAHGKGEDKRYAVIRANNEPGFKYKSLYIVFWLQAVLASIITIPLIVSVNSADSLQFLDFFGILIWSIGMGFEAISDYQLTTFRAAKANKDSVLNKGLWKYSRHPNYFGECVLWWGFYLIACSAGGWWTAFAPILVTALLLKVSGVSLLESTISHRRPAYLKYIQTTNAFFPGRPKNGDLH